MHRFSRWRRWRPLALALALALGAASATAGFAGVAAAAPAKQRKRTLRVGVLEIGPTQEQVGRAIALLTMKALIKDAPKGGEAKYVREVLPREIDKKTFRAVIDPDGVPRILDGHHRAYALALLGKRYGVDFRLRLDVVHDYRGWSHARYAKHLTQVLQMGQFSQRTRRKYPAKYASSAQKRVDSLPRTVLECKDSPLRSTVSAALWFNGVDGDNFVDYVEFRLADHLRRDPKVPTSERALRGRELHKSAIAPIAQALFGAHRPYLERLARPGHEATALSEIASGAKKLGGTTRMSQTRTWRRQPRRRYRRVQRRRSL